jgi:hypothetical protein
VLEHASKILFERFYSCLDLPLRASFYLPRQMSFCVWLSKISTTNAPICGGSHDVAKPLATSSRTEAVIERLQGLLVMSRLEC